MERPGVATWALGPGGPWHRSSEGEGEILTSPLHPGTAWTGDLHSVGLLESPNLLDLIHEVATVDVLHHKIQAVLRERGRKMVEDA